MIDEKTGELLPPYKTKQPKDPKLKLIPFVPENVTNEMIEAQLGNSIGIRNQLNT
jgi:hypothetical protein